MHTFTTYQQPWHQVWELASVFFKIQAAYYFAFTFGKPISLLHPWQPESFACTYNTELGYYIELRRVWVKAIYALYTSSPKTLYLILNVKSLDINLWQIWSKQAVKFSNNMMVESILWQLNNSLGIKCEWSMQAYFALTFGKPSWLRVHGRHKVLQLVTILK